MQDNASIHVGMDLGGTVRKVTVVSRQHIDLPYPHDTFSLKEQQYLIYTISFLSIEQCYNFIQVHLLPVAPRLTVGITGGGAVKYVDQIQKILPQNKLHLLNQFDSCVKGVEFIRQARVPVTLDQFTKDTQGKITHKTRQATLDELQLNFLFVSLGSGICVQKYVSGERGMERGKAEDLSTAKTPDGYILGGTSLGAGFLMGLGRFISGERDFSVLLKQMQERDEMREIYSTVMTNLMQMSLQLSILHSTPNIMPSGSLLKHVKDLNAEFQEAMRLDLNGVPLKRSLVMVKRYQGYLGALGVLCSLLLPQ